MTLYSCRTADGSFRITKFDNDLNPEASYLVSPEACECPAGVRPTCRHRQMLPAFIASDAIDSPLMLDWDQKPPEWVDTSSISDTTLEGLAERPINPAVNELMDLAPEARVLTEAETLEAHNEVARALDLPEEMLPVHEALTQEDIDDLPAGVTILGMDDLFKLHNTIADAVGEPLIQGPEMTATEVRARIADSLEAKLPSTIRRV